MAAPENFAVFILTHGRANRVNTYTTIRRHGYTGPVVIVVDDEDPQLGLYREKFDQVAVFSKDEVAKRTQLADNFHDKKGVIIFARNACYEIAEQLGYRDFIQLDDDYSAFRYKTDGKGNYVDVAIKDLDSVFGAMRDFYRSVPDLKVFAMLQNGDFIGGAHGTAAQKATMVRKIMNSLLCSTDRPFSFVGRINEDVNTYVHCGSQGHLLLSTSHIALNHQPTQQKEGGMTGVYLDGGTYVKSFYTVMFQPGSVAVAMMHSKFGRIHHQIDWELAVPKILPPSLKKEHVSA